MNIPILISALWAIGTETIEDSFALTIYRALFGTRIVRYALIASLVTTGLTVAGLAFFGATLFSYSIYVTYGSGLFFIGLGIYWIVAFRKTREQEIKGKGAVTALPAFMIVFAEMMEITVLLIPLIVANYLGEVVFAYIASIGFTLLFLSAVGSRLGKFKQRLQLLKIISGIALITAGIMIVFNG